MPFKRRPFTAKKKETRLKKVENKVRKLVSANKSERHMLNNTVADASIDILGIVFYMSTIAVGDLNESRTGAVVSNVTIDYRMTIACTATTWVRYIIFQDTNQDGTAPTVTDILQTQDVRSQYNVPNWLNKRFRIIDDTSRSLVLGTDNTIHISAHSVRKKLSNIHFQGDDGLQASSGKNGLYCLMISSTDEAGVMDLRYSIKFDP